MGTIMTHTITCFIGSIFYNDIGLVVLEVPEREKDNVSLVDPHLRSKVGSRSIETIRAYLLPHFASDMCQSLLPIKALCLQSAISQHLCYLGILLSIFTEYKFTLVIVILILPTSPIFPALYSIQVNNHAIPMIVHDKPFLYSEGHKLDHIKECIRYFTLGMLFKKL